MLGPRVHDGTTFNPYTDAERHSAQHHRQSGRRYHHVKNLRADHSTYSTIGQKLVYPSCVLAD